MFFFNFFFFQRNPLAQNFLKELGESCEKTRSLLEFSLFVRKFLKKNDNFFCKTNKKASIWTKMN